MSLGLVVLEKKLFTQTRTRTYTPQSDDIKKGPDGFIPNFTTLGGGGGGGGIAPMILIV